MQVLKAFSPFRTCILLSGKIPRFKIRAAQRHTIIIHYSFFIIH